MLISSYPRSGSTWFSRVLADSLDVYLAEGDYRVPNSAEKIFIKISRLHDQKISPAFILKQHIEKYETAQKSKNNLDQIILYIFRDPRDVMISYFFFQAYRRRKSVLFTYRNIIKEFLDLLTGGRRWRPNIFRFGKSQKFDTFFSEFILAFLPE